MRTTNSMSERAVIQSITDAYEKMSIYQRQVSSGKRINVPSDDPVGTYRTMTYSTTISRVGQYKTNIDTAVDEMNTLSMVLSNILDRLIMVKEVSTSADNDILPQSQLDMYAYQVDEVIKTFVDYGNTTFANKYLFSGYLTDTTPFTTTVVGGYITAVTYNGDTGQRQIEVNTSRQVAVNLVGDNTADPTVAGAFIDANAPASDIFSALIALRDDLFAGNLTNVRTVDLQDIDNHRARVETVLGSLGVRLQELMDLQDMHQEDYLSKIGLRSDVEDVDAFEAMSNMSNQQTTYQAALQVGSRILQLNLFDYLD
jgi:flagellar hook-associated protein 3 FlgL